MVHQTIHPKSRDSKDARIAALESAIARRDAALAKAREALKSLQVAAAACSRVLGGSPVYQHGAMHPEGILEEVEPALAAIAEVENA